MISEIRYWQKSIISSWTLSSLIKMMSQVADLIGQRNGCAAAAAPCIAAINPELRDTLGCFKEVFEGCIGKESGYILILYAVFKAMVDLDNVVRAMFNCVQSQIAQIAMLTNVSNAPVAKRKQMDL